MANGNLKQIQSLKIEVVPPRDLPAPGSPVECELRELGSSGPGRLKGGKIELDAGEGPFCIEFKLSGNLDWKAGDPVWTDERQCPASGQTASQQIWVDRNPDKKSLTLLNMNVGASCDIHYRLNFTDGYYYDPIMSNGGGNIISFR